MTEKEQLRFEIDKIALVMGLLSQIQRNLIEILEAQKGDDDVSIDQPLGGREGDELCADGPG